MTATKLSRVIAYPGELCLDQARAREQLGGTGGAGVSCSGPCVGGRGELRASNSLVSSLAIVVADGNATASPALLEVGEDSVPAVAWSWAWPGGLRRTHVRPGPHRPAAAVRRRSGAVRPGPPTRAPDSCSYASLQVRGERLEQRLPTSATGRRLGRFALDQPRVGVPGRPRRAAGLPSQSRSRASCSSSSRPWGVDQLLVALGRACAPDEHAARGPGRSNQQPVEDPKQQALLGDAGHAVGLVLVALGGVDHGGRSGGGGHRGSGQASVRWPDQDRAGDLAHTLAPAGRGSNSVVSRLVNCLVQVFPASEAVLHFDCRVDSAIDPRGSWPLW